MEGMTGTMTGLGSVPLSSRGVLYGHALYIFFVSCPSAKWKPPNPVPKAAAILPEQYTLRSTGRPGLLTCRRATGTSSLSSARVRSNNYSPYAASDVKVASLRSAIKLLTAGGSI